MLDSNTWRAAAAVMLVLFTTACGGGEAAAREATVVVTFWHAMGGPLGDVLLCLVDEFNSTHPGIEVVPVSMGSYRALSQKIMASVMAGDPPELAQAYETWTAQLIRGGAIVPLDSLMDLDPDFERGDWLDFVEVFREDNTFDGRVYSFPFNKSVPVIYYNVQLFDSLGLSPASTWEEQRELLFDLSLDGNADGDKFDEGDRWGTAFPVSVWMFECLLLQSGGDLIDESGTATAFASPEGIEALEYLSGLVTEDSTAYLSTGFEHQREFSEGRVGLVQGSIVSLSFMQDDMRRRAESGLPVFEIGVAALPAGRERAVLISGTNVVIFGSDHPEKVLAAWEFVKWFTDTEQQARWFSGTYYLPARSSSISHPASMEACERVPGLRDALGQLEYATFEPQMTAWYDGREFLAEAVEIALYGRMSPAEALRRAADLSDSEI
ncbi:ABC transporter substrate-binding protein, partial [Candidatus Fermentibacterales bacterium]|nr:ABC transporter substrate-binding protein [Candidatus Fermentibacterales bacterium]